MSISDKALQLKTDFDEVYEAGKKAEYDAFWDAFQENGNRDYYYYGFAYRWNDGCYNPKYPIICGEGTNNGNNVFRSSGITDTKVPIYITTSCQAMFYGCTDLKNITKLVVNENTSFANAFYQVYELENIVIEGVIGKDIDFKACAKLTHDSLMSIINALKDGVSGLTCSLGTMNLNKLTDAEKKIATDKGWQLA